MKLVPYVMFPGNAEEALNFYKDCLGGNILALQKYGEANMASSEEDKNKVLHASFEFDGNHIMVSDGSKERPVVMESNIHLSLDLDNIDKLEDIFSKMGEGGKINMPLENTFWGARFGMLTDKFGVHWMFNHDFKK